MINTHDISAQTIKRCTFILFIPLCIVSVMATVFSLKQL